MTVKELTEKMEWKLAAGSGEKEITSAYVCDLLSWVIAHGQPGTAWVTVQTHENVLAVASLHDFACVIIPDKLELSDRFLSTAEDKGIAVISTPCTSYGVAKALAQLDVTEVS